MPIRLAVIAAVLAVATPVDAAKDNRFFNRVYLTETEAVALQKEKPADRAVLERITLTPDEVEIVKKNQRVRMMVTGYRVYRLYRTGEAEPYRYAVFMQEPGQHEHMDLMYGVNPDGKIHRVDLLIYREPHGGEVAGSRFMKQFEGKSLAANRLRVNHDVVHIVGATISANSVANAARRALEILRIRGYTR